MHRGEENQRQGGNKIKSRSTIYTPAFFSRSMGELGLDYPLRTFSIGMEGSPDLASARKVADFLGTEHHEIKFTPQEGFDALEDVIRHLEIYDVITIRFGLCLTLLDRDCKCTVKPRKSFAPT